MRGIEGLRNQGTATDAQSRGPGYCNKSSWPGGDARGGPRAPCNSTAISSRLRTVAVAASRPPQRGQAKTSMAKMRASSLAQPMRRGLAGSASLSVGSARALWRWSGAS